eukprot:15365665-Ditylum_brightwellii.AAC.1
MDSLMKSNLIIATLGMREGGRKAKGEPFYLPMWIREGIKQCHLTCPEAWFLSILLVGDM